MTDKTEKRLSPQEYLDTLTPEERRELFLALIGEPAPSRGDRTRPLFRGAAVRLEELRRASPVRVDKGGRVRCPHCAFSDAVTGLIGDVYEHWSVRVIAERESGDPKSNVRVLAETHTRYDATNVMLCCPECQAYFQLA